MNSSVSKNFSSKLFGGFAAFAKTLRNANYDKLLLGLILAAFGDRINQIALLDVVVRRFGGNVSKYSADIMFWAILPSILLTPFSLAWVDRWNRRHAMIACDLARALLVGSLPFLMAWNQHHYVIYGIVFLVGTFKSFFDPCRQAILPTLVPSNLLGPANALSSQAATIASVAGMAIGTGLVRAFGSNLNFEINAATYLASAALIFGLRPTSSVETEIRMSAARHPIQEIRMGLVYTWQTPPILLYVVFFGFVQFLGGTFIVCFISYTKDILGFGTPGIAICFLVMIFGMAPAALVMGFLAQKRETFLLPMFMTCLAGAGVTILNWVRHPLWVGMAFFGIGFCLVLVLAPLDTFIQKKAPQELHGRVFAARLVLMGAFMLLSLQLSKGFIHQVGTPHTLMFLGMAAILAGLAGAWIGWRTCLKRL